MVASLSALVDAAEFVVDGKCYRLFFFDEGLLVAIFVTDGVGLFFFLGRLGWCCRFGFLILFYFVDGDDVFDVGHVDVDFWRPDVDFVDEDEENNGEEGKEHQCAPFDEVVAVLGDKVAGDTNVVAHDDVAFTPPAKTVANDRGKPHHPEQGAPEGFAPWEEVFVP